MKARITILNSVIFAIIFCALCPLSASAANKTYIAPAAEREKAEDLTAAYLSLKTQIPKELYDVDALAEMLDYDVDAASEFVRDEIHYDPYLGVMRGPQGTISAKAGSTWDQAVLLAAIINSMAGEALIVKGTLGDDDVNRLLLESFGPRNPLKTPLTIDNVSEALGSFMPASRLKTLKAEAREVEMDGAASAQGLDDLADRLYKALNEAGVTLKENSPNRLNKLRGNLAEEYVWVRYRNTPNDPWVNVHPAFGSTKAPDVEPEKFVANKVPKERLHEIELRLEIERKIGDKVERASIMTPYRRPAANLAATQINIGISPSSNFEDGEEAGYFTPLLNDAEAPGAQVFTLLGQTAAAGDVSAGPEVFREVSENFAGALGALNEATGVEDGGPRLSGVILEVIHISPDGSETVESRRLVDFREGLPKNASAQITFKGVMDINVGMENNARALETLFAAEGRRAKSLPYFGAFLSGKITAEEAGSHPAFASDQMPTLWSQMLLMGGAFNGRVQDNHTVVRLAPMVSMLRVKGQTNENGIFTRIVDILRDETIALRREGNTVKTDIKANLTEGIRLTMAEQTLAPGTKSRSWTDMPVKSVISDPEAVTNWIKNNNESAGVKDRLLADLDMADALVLVENSIGPRWWRINTQTGQTLGMGLEGGAELTEFTITELVLGTYTITMLVKGHFDCADTYPNNQSMQTCCQLGNVMLTAGTAGAGAVVGRAGSAMFDGAWKAGLGLFAYNATWEVGSSAVSYAAGTQTDSICRSITQ